MISPEAPTSSTPLEITAAQAGNYPWLDQDKDLTEILAGLRNKVLAAKAEDGSLCLTETTEDSQTVFRVGDIVVARCNKDASLEDKYRLLKPLADIQVLSARELRPYFSSAAIGTTGSADTARAVTPITAQPVTAEVVDEDDIAPGQGLTAVGRILAQWIQTSAVTDPEVQQKLRQAVSEEIERIYGESAARNDRAAMQRLVETSTRVFAVINEMGVSVGSWEEFLAPALAERAQELGLPSLEMRTPAGFIAALAIYEKVTAAVLAAQTIASERADHRFDLATQDMSKELAELEIGHKRELEILRQQARAATEKERLEAEQAVAIKTVEVARDREQAAKAEQDLAAIQAQSVGKLVANLLAGAAHIIPAPFRGFTDEVINWLREKPVVAASSMVAAGEVAIGLALGWPPEITIPAGLLILFVGTGGQALLEQRQSQPLTIKTSQTGASNPHEENTANNTTTG